MKEACSLQNWSGHLVVCFIICSEGTFEFVFLGKACAVTCLLLSKHRTAGEVALYLVEITLLSFLRMCLTKSKVTDGLELKFLIWL